MVACAWIFLSLLCAANSAPECKSFEEIYSTGKELCENMWGGAFKYETDEDDAYTMWFFDSANPNDATAQSLGVLNGAHDTCHLQYWHKSAPSPEPDAFTECHPWKDSACCSHSTVETYQNLKEGYGPEYHWDRCGPLSQECERFFVQEACFYECDPNAGLYRKYPTSVYDERCDEYAAGYDAAYAASNNCDHNTWQMHNMPIKKSYCDAWFTACRHDKFCASDSGDYFSCAAEYQALDEAAELNATKSELEQLKAENEALEKAGIAPGLLVAIILPSLVACVAFACSCYLIRREQMGKPFFERLNDDGDRGTPSTVGAGQA